MLKRIMLLAGFFIAHQAAFADDSASENPAIMPGLDERLRQRGNQFDEALSLVPARSGNRRLHPLTAKRAAAGAARGGRAEPAVQHRERRPAAASSSNR